MEGLTGERMARPGVGPPDAGLPHGEHGPPRDGVQDDMALAHYMGNPLPEEEEDSATSTPTAAAAAAASQSTSAVQTSSVEQISTTTSECRSSSTQVTISTSVPVVENNHTLPSSSHSSECSLPTAPLTNQEQVGDSIIGTLCQSPLPKWLEKPDGTKYTSAPWKNATTKKTDPTLEGHIPVTNVTRRYDFTVSRGTLSPDGVLRDVILVNNQYPGPTIEANFGDVVEIRVVNNITNPEEGTALHWHGMLQRGMPWEDGAPGMTQCPIAPGAEFTYSWRAETYGTSYWHAHYSAQYTAGVVGAMVIHGPSVSDYDVDIGPVMLNDCTSVPGSLLVDKDANETQGIISRTSVWSKTL